MTCREVIDFLGAYVDGDLAEDVRLRFERHVAACPPCAGYLESYRDTVRLAKDTARRPDESLPAEVPEDLLKAILSARRKC
jgi:anti-sigma factor RsiW